MPKKRADSAHEHTKIMQEAATVREPPAHLKLRPQDVPFWRAIIKARLTWTDVDLQIAANMARCQADIEENQKKLDVEGAVLENMRGTPVMNPRFTILEQLTRRSVALSRMLQVHAAATIGETKLNKGKNAAKQDALNALENLDDDDLIPN